MAKKKLDKLSNAILLEWKQEIDQKDLSTAMKKNIFKTFSGLLNFAVKMEYLPKNPLTNIGNFKEVLFEKPQDKIRFYTPEQFSKYIEIAYADAKNTGDWRYYVFFMIAYLTGCRKGEIHALKWSDLEGNVLHIRRSVNQKSCGGYTETPPKNSSSYRDIQIPQNLISVLNEHKQRQKECRIFSESFRIIGGTNWLSDTGIENRNKKYSAAAGLPHIRIHDFRHSHASLLANNSINIQEVARRLGHSKVKITWNTYSHLYPKEEERALRILENVVTKKTILELFLNRKIKNA